MRIIQSETKNHWSTAVTLSNVCPYWNNWYAEPFFKPFWKDQTLKAMCHVLLRECPQLGMPPKTKRKSLSTKAGFPQSPWADRERLRQHFHSSFGADQNGGKRIWDEWSLENRVSMLTYHSNFTMWRFFFVSTAKGLFQYISGKLVSFCFGTCSRELFGTCLFSGILSKEFQPGRIW